MKIYPDGLLILLTDKGFDEAFCAGLKKCATPEQAYNRIETVLKYWFNFHKYANYASYIKDRKLRIPIQF